MGPIMREGRALEPVIEAHLACLPRDTRTGRLHCLEWKSHAFEESPFDPYQLYAAPQGPTAHWRVWLRKRRLFARHAPSAQR